MGTSVAASKSRGEELFRLAVESSPSAMVMVNHKGKIVLVNTQTEKLFGYCREELLGQPVEILVPDSSRGNHSGLRHSFAKEPLPRPIGGREVWARRKDGSEVPVEIGLNTIQTEDGTWVLSAIVDISARKRVEAKLRESEERFGNMADTAPVMIWVSGTDKHCTFFNKAWLEFRGRTMEQELGDGWSDGVHPDDFQRCLSTYCKSFDARSTFQMEYRLRRADGEYRWILDNGVPRYESDGVFAGYVGSCIDITDLKAAHEDDLRRRKLESLGLLARGVGHDFNNLQSAIIMIAETLLERLEANSIVAPEIKQIRDIAMRGSDLTRQLTIYAGQDIADMEPVNLSQVVEEMHTLLEVSIAKRAKLTTHLDRNLPVVMANSGHIRQILLNLVMNAAEAMGDKPGAIDITTSRTKIAAGHDVSLVASLKQGEYLKLEISDTGRGIRREHQAKIFDPFFTTKTAGHGLGLSVVHGIVRRYEGSLGVQSTPNKGTRIEILLPTQMARAHIGSA